jgi:drug/metabolite transporter (DMT)-like permease
MSNVIQTSAYTQATLLSVVGFIITVIISPLFGGLFLDFSKISILTLLLVVLTQGLGNITYFAALKKLTNGTAQIAFSSILFFNVILAVAFLSLQLSLINLLGVVILASAILIAVSGKVELNKSGIGIMILSAFLFSIFQLASSELSQEVSAASYLGISFLGAVVVIFALKSRTIINDISKLNKGNTLKLSILAALPSVGYFIFSYYAYRSAPEPSKVALLLTSQVVLTIVLSYFILKERGYLKRKLLASVLVVISAALIKN